MSVIHKMMSTLLCPKAERNKSNKSSQQYNLLTCALLYKPNAKRTNCKNVHVIYETRFAIQDDDDEFGMTKHAHQSNTIKHSWSKLDVE